MPKPIVTHETSQYDDRHEYSPDCACESCRARSVSDWLRHSNAKPVMRLPLRFWLLAFALSAAIILAGGIVIAHATGPFPGSTPPTTPIVAKARQACPAGSTVLHCRNALRHAYAAISWERKQRLDLARQMLGNVAAWTCIHNGTKPNGTSVGSGEGSWTDAGDPYWGGLQMDRGFMRTYGSDMIRHHHGGLADIWTPREQIIVAQRAFMQGRGYAPWPQTSRACGLR